MKPSRKIEMVGMIFVRPRKAERRWDLDNKSGKGKWLMTTDARWREGIQRAEANSCRIDRHE